MALAMLLLAAAAGEAAAQAQSPSPPTTPRTTRPAPAQPVQPAPPPEPPPPPYERTMLRLAEVMGSVAVLKDLCAEPDADEWRTKMTAILEVEGTSAGRRERLAGAYNRGFSAFTLTYRQCTESAREALARYVREGSALTRELKGRYSE
jgi:uncharacterized protein (TIGR02301 family)